MALIIYQIGDVPLYHTLVGKDGTGVTLQPKRSWRTPGKELQGVGGEVSYLPYTTALGKAPTYTLDGWLKGSEFYSAQQTINRLLSLGGIRDVPVIGFNLENPPAATDPLADITWLYTRATVTDVDPTNVYHETAGDFDMPPISLSLKGQLRWKVMSPWEWEYRSPEDFIIDTTSVAAQPIGGSPTLFQPQTLNEFREDYYFFPWFGRVDRYDPYYWGRRFSGGLPGGSGSDFAEFQTGLIYSDPLRWSAQPSSVYAFTGLSPDGELRIRVKQVSGVFNTPPVTRTSTLDLVALHADLVTGGYEGLLDTDIIMTGALAPIPGVIFREGIKLTGLSPRWDYPDTYPGETGRGYNEITPYLTGTVSSPRWAYLHEFGTL